MNPDIEDFLEEAFASIKPTSKAIGRVVVEPNYESDLAANDIQRIRAEFLELLNGHQLNTAALNTIEGFEVIIPNRYELLSQYIRRIVLHADTIEGDWVEVAPPGNWI